MRDPAFDDEMLPHLTAVFDVACRLAGSRSEAEDLTQETFLRAFSAFDRFEPGSSARAWLLTILRNHHRNRIRDGSRHREECLDEDTPAPPGADAPDWDALTREDLDAAIAALPLRHREIVVLRELQHLTYKDIATVLGCPVGTVMSRLHRARSELRRQLGVRLGRATRRGAL